VTNSLWLVAFWRFYGQYGKFFGSYRNVPWYIEDKKEAEELASKLGFKVSEEKEL
jgi:hypothetical protein